MIEVLCRDAPFAVCACGRPFRPDDPDVTHKAHYLCADCREEIAA